MTTRFCIAALLMSASLSVSADEFGELLASAVEAYEAGDLAAASEDLSFAQQHLTTRQGEAFAQLLPEPLEGWTREVDMQQNAAMGMLGGGLSVEGSYTGESGSFTISMMADNPGMMQMAGMYSNPQMLATMGEVIRIRRQSFVINRSGEISGVVGGRTLIQASGRAPREDILAHLEAMDFNAINAR